MDTDNPPRLTEANRTDNGVVIGFEDGRIAFYPAELLSAMISRAQEIVDTEDEE